MPRLSCSAGALARVPVGRALLPVSPVAPASRRLSGVRLALARAVQAPSDGHFCQACFSTCGLLIAAVAHNRSHSQTNPTTINNRKSKIGNWQLAIGNRVRPLLSTQFLRITTTLIFFVLLIRPLCAQNTQPLPSADTYRVAGIVVSSQTNHPIAGARVTISSVRNPQQAMSMVTSDTGAFEFTGVPAGKYPLQGAAKGFIPAAYDQHEQFSTAIVTGAGVDTEHLVLRLAPAASISGKVLDEAGEPVRHAVVTLYRDVHGSGVSRITRTRTAETDDQGSYELAPLIPGTFFLSVSANPWYAVHPVAFRQEGPSSPPSLVDRSLDVAYPITYYADATAYEDATPVPVRGGDHPQIDFHLQPVPALHLLYHVPDAGKNGFQMPDIQRRSFDALDNSQGVSWQGVSEGVFELTLPPGSYVVRSSAGGSGMRTAEITFDKDGQELDTSGGEALGSVKATVIMPADAQLPKGAAPAPSAGAAGATLPELLVVLRDSRGRNVTGQPVGENNQVAFDNLAPGKYEVQIGSNQGAYSIARISDLWTGRVSASGETSGHTLTVAPGAQLEVALSLTSASATIEGFARHAGQPVPGAMIVLVPKNPEVNHALFRRDQSDLDGSFTLPDVSPGDYRVVAIENGWDLDWAKPGVIARYARNGQALTVPADKKGPIHLAEPIEVQSR
jgi:Carboxypeptidase regulatory-like domain